MGFSVSSVSAVIRGGAGVTAGGGGGGGTASDPSGGWLVGKSVLMRTTIGVDI